MMTAVMTTLKWMQEWLDWQASSMPDCCRREDRRAPQRQQQQRPLVLVWAIGPRRIRLPLVHPPPRWRLLHRCTLLLPLLRPASTPRSRRSLRLLAPLLRLPAPALQSVWWPATKPPLRVCRSCHSRPMQINIASWVTRSSQRRSRLRALRLRRPRLLLASSRRWLPLPNDPPAVWASIRMPPATTRVLLPLLLRAAPLLLPCRTRSRSIRNRRTATATTAMHRPPLHRLRGPSCLSAAPRRRLPARVPKRATAVVGA